ncbi:MAG TPA: hypothetical protein VFP65_27855 [Anaeromyxobacteraceae bacterium]|nr:hypothetical protein [Anaeromyxobacteraceae bacterium]
MRPSLHLAAACLAAALACTSPNEGQPPPLQVKGAVAVAPAAVACDLAGTPLTVTALGIHLSPSSEGAFLANPANLCRQRANETTVNLVLWANGAGAPATFAAGAYTPHADATGGLSAFQVRLDGSCAVTPPNVFAQRGTVTLSSVTDQRVAGSVDLVFDDGRTLAASFDAAVVPSAASPCDMFGVQGGAPGVGCGARTCSP